VTDNPVTITQIGRMRSRVTFQALLEVSDGQGGQTESWSDLSTDPTVWCYLRPTKSNERFFSEQIQYQRSHEAIIRYRNDLETEMRVLFDGRVFQIKGIRRPDERKAFLILDLEENQGT
jgi:SPP1 family predicted phage head-tail adaptor